jgi:protein TonB
MINLLSRDFSQAAIALLTGILFTFGLFLMIQILSATRGSDGDKPPLLVINLMQWQPSQPIPKAVPLPKPISPPKVLRPKPEKPAPVIPTRIEPIPDPMPKSEPSQEPQPAEPAEVPLSTPTVDLSLPEEPLPADTLLVPVPLFQLTVMPHFLHREMPLYPESLRIMGRSGVVKLEVLIDETGKVRQVTILESAGALFDHAAEQAIIASSFIPAEVNGQPVTVLLRLPVRFRLR